MSATSSSPGRAPRMFEVPLPYGRPPLLDNHRQHWAQRSRLVRQIRRDTAHMARFGQLPRGLGRVEIVLHWQPATRRRRDHTAAAPTLKACVDGLIDYGLVPDDDVEHVFAYCRIEPVAPQARVWLTVEELQ